jgi:hypothetical protein
MTTATTTQPQPERPIYPPELLPEIKQELQPDCRKLQKLLDRHRHSFLKGYFEIGRFVQDVCNRHRSRHRTIYGAAVIEHLAAAAGLHDRTVHYCLQLATLFNESEYEALIARKGITWTHVTHLLGVADAGHRAELAEQIEGQGWTPDDLLAAILRLYGHRRQGSGRRPALPRNAGQALTRLSKAASRFRSLIEQAVFSEEFDLSTALFDMSPDDVTAGLRDDVVAAAEMLEAISTTTKENAGRMRDGATRLREVLVARTAPAKPIAEETTDV